MNNVISFTPSELVAFIGTIAGVCAGIATIVGVICKVVMRLKAPEVEQNKRIKALEEENKSRKEEIETERKERQIEIEKLNDRLRLGNKRFDNIEESTKITLETLRALLKHALGGDESELKEAEKSLDNYLQNSLFRNKQTE